MKAVEAQEKPQAQAATPLAIVGIGSLFPQANDTGTFWSNIRQGVDAITEVPESHWRSDDYFDPDPKAPDRVYAKYGGFLTPIDFRPMDYGILPNALEAIDTSQLLGLVAVDQALSDAGYGAGRDYDRDRVSVILGVTGTLELVIPLGARLGHPRWREALRDAGIADEIAADVMQRISDSYVPWQENSFPGLLGNVVAGRISKHFDFGGTNCVVDAACGSSLSALHLAALELETGRADMVVSGGIDTFNDIFMYSCFSKTPALSPSGHARPFDADGDGTTLGEGLGIVILKRLADAERDGDRVYAIIKGIGSSSDGRGAAIYEPSAAGQQKALRRAYRQAGIEPDSIGLIEAHGTGTKVGDAVEVTALRGVFGEARQPWCAIGSIKSQIGHTKAAAGAAGLIKAALALYHKTLPPTIKVKQPLAAVADGSSPFYVNSEARPWLAHAATPRRAGVSALGFGGSNFHCLLEEHRPGKPSADWSGDEQILAFCADQIDRLASAIAEFPIGGSWDEVRLAADRSRRDFDGQKACRLLVVTSRREQNLAKQLQTAQALLRSRQEEPFWSTPDGICFGQGSLPGELALLFPGQGAQYPGMLRELAIQFPAFFETVSAADRAFATNAAADGRLSARIYPPPPFTPTDRSANEAALTATEIAQPALGAVSLAALEMLRGFGVEAAAFAGHSYGELVALCAAGCFDADSLHALSRLRGELMATGAGDRGTMLAVAAPLAQIEAFLAASGLPLVLANRNTPEQGVLSGATTDIERAAQQLVEQGMRQTRLAVSAAFHSDLVAGAARPFGERLGAIDFRPPARPVYANSSAAPYPDEVAAARDLLAGQLARPVDFVAQIEAMYTAGMRLFLEVGPGARLTGMVKAILGDRPHQALALDASAGKRSGIVDLGRALAQLAALGLPLQLDNWDAGHAERQAARPAKKPGLTVTLTGANYFQPPPKRPALPLPDVVAVPSPSTAVAPTAAAPPPAVAGPALTDALQISRQSLAALQELQEQTARLHQQFLAGQEAASRTFLSLVEQQNCLLGGAPGQLPTTSTIVDSGAADRPVGVSSEILPATSQPATAPAPSADTAVAPAPAGAGPANERVAAVLLAVIAEKTGYPVEMLETGMTLDADLGIDSIKRVEILSALQEQLPEAPPVKPEDLGVLQTIGQIIDHLTVTAPPAPSTVTTAAPLASERVAAVLLAVIAEKTGYPVEMLETGMTLDADLGIDSIKRVEILSALQDKLPEAPPIKPEHLGTLQTIGQIVDFLTSVSGGAETQRQPAHHAEPLPTGTGIERLELRSLPLPVETDRLALKLATHSRVWVTSDGSPLTEALCTELAERGLIAETVDVRQADSLTVPDDLAGLLILAPVSGSDSGFLANAFRLAQRTEPALLTSSRRGGAALATVARLNGHFGLAAGGPVRDPLSGGLAGLSKTAGLEWSGVNCRAFDLAADLADDRDTARRLLDELLVDGAVETGLTRAGLITLELVANTADDEPGPLPFGYGDVVVVSGGGRGVTAATAVALARTSHATLVLLGRSPEPQAEPAWLDSLQSEAEIKKALLDHAGATLTPKELGARCQAILANREIRATLQQIKAAGGQPLYRCVDLRDRAAVAEVLNDIRAEYGPIRALVHGAGVLADRLIKDKTPEQFATVYATKVDGLLNLLAAVDSDELRGLVLFSSSTGRYGRKGQVDYALANEVLNKIAWQQAALRPDCRVLSLNWGPWDGGMVTPALKKVFANEGVPLIDLQAGADTLARELGTPPGGPVELVILGATDQAAGAPAQQHENIYVTKAFDLDLSVASCPFLADHVIDGKAVLPMALMIEWLAHAAIHNNPGLRFHGFNDLRVLKGVTLGHDQTHTLQAMTGKAFKSDGMHLVPVELSGTAGGRQFVHARAKIILANKLPAGKPAMPRSDLAAYPRPIAEIYQPGRLFHGRQLQGIREVLGCAAAGIASLVRPAPAPGEWLSQPMRTSWLADPLALDCSFQLMILWSFENCKAGSLPVSAGRYRQYRERFPESGTEIRITVGRHSDNKALAEIDFVDPASSELVARIEDYECVIDASLSDSFQRNRLRGVA